MKRWKKIIIFVSLLLILLLAAPFAAFAVDYNKIKHGEHPVFCSKYSALLDGGTIICQYEGYRIIKWNRISGKRNVEFRFGAGDSGHLIDKDKP